MTFAKEIKIGGINVGEGHRAFIIAEAGVNHDGRLDIAKKLVDEAKRVGADAVKFQAFRAERLVSGGTPKVEHHKYGADPKETHFDMIRRLEVSLADQKELFEYCKQKGILFLSTPYDVQSAKDLEKLGVLAFKTASADIVDLPLHDYIASTGKPCIIAVGMATFDEIKQVLAIYTKHKNPNVMLLHCVSSYPAKKERLNLRVIPEIKKKFKTIVGYSDHSEGNTAVAVSRALGATVFEKHFTLNRSAPGPDHSTSETPAEFLQLVRTIRDAEIELGSNKKELQPEEKSMHAFSRKSLVTVRDIPAGTTLKRDMLTLKRPGTGIPYSKIKTVLGKKTKRTIPADTVLSKKDLNA